MKKKERERDEYNVEGVGRERKVPVNYFNCLLILLTDNVNFLFDTEIIRVMATALVLVTGTSLHIYFS